MLGIYAVFLSLVLILSLILIFDKDYPDSLLERLGLTGSGLFSCAEMYHLAINGGPGPAANFLLVSLALLVLGFMLAPLCKRLFG